MIGRQTRRAGAPARADRRLAERGLPAAVPAHGAGGALGGCSLVAGGHGANRAHGVRDHDGRGERGLRAGRGGQRRARARERRGAMPARRDTEHCETNIAPLQRARWPADGGRRCAVALTPAAWSPLSTATALSASAGRVKHGARNPRGRHVATRMSNARQETARKAAGSAGGGASARRLARTRRRHWRRERGVLTAQRLSYPVSRPFPSEGRADRQRGVPSEEFPRPPPCCPCC